eukprot:TRINITY_DN29434_c0_g1_i1.p1 TRINITY_DN29434_c0_g1~~TRINITY_DN29434_c0_g1_i1.p1  ORF type:complete len:238 (-),score=20.28 TRINITY_DN29434_c0_g1_i1:130-816(-)
MTAVFPLRCCCVGDQDAEISVAPVDAKHVSEVGIVESVADRFRLDTEPPVKPYECVFDVAVQSNGRLGLVLEAKYYGMLSVLRIREDSCLHSYNLTAVSERRVQKHDFIMEVNGKTTKAEILEEVRGRPRSFSMQILRPHKFRVTIHKGSASFGAKLNFEKSGVSLDIEELVGGALIEYNKGAQPNERICVRDFICEVNGVSESSEKMLNEIRAASELHLLIGRPPSA